MDFAFAEVTQRHLDGMVFEGRVSASYKYNPIIISIYHGLVDLCTSSLVISMTSESFSVLSLSSLGSSEDAEKFSSPESEITFVWGFFWACFVVFERSLCHCLNFWLQISQPFVQCREHDVLSLKIIDVSTTK